MTCDSFPHGIYPLVGYTIAAILSNFNTGLAGATPILSPQRVSEFDSEKALMAEETGTHVPKPSSAIPNSSEEKLKQPQVPAFPGLLASPNGDIQMYPIMYPALVPGLIPLQNQEQNNRGAGIYAVPVLQCMGPMAGLSTNTLIPLTYSIPTRTSPPEGAAIGEEHGQEGRPQHPPQRQIVVRRFHFAIQLDLLLILKLAAVIFVFNQDGSRHRLILLVFFASLVYLYQTGALTPLIRWLSQGMQRAPPQPRAVLRAENAPAARQEDENAAHGDVQPGLENDNRHADDTTQPAENENQAEPDARGGVNWWGIVKEFQMIVVGFITSLLPGYHNVD
ncbi:uncharacterized protein LOC122071189 [Macadamia integrifolia]|uniref:uncharacterized protein LOC122071189 n=1 Tax=Macadamia integrifolia TaxID=60698 RepID=UPI001C4E8BB4|nr:uncharacterized protein LOC122071189 [Macadamia integrifolia]